MADPFILSLDESSALYLVGGKAAGLAKALTAGFPVPKGLCVTTAVYQQGLDQAGVDAPAIWRKLPGLSVEQRAQELARIQQLLLDQPWPAGFPDDLETQLTRLGGDSSTRWAVRSSATNEDAADMSAAGLYRTTLGVSPAAVLQSIRDCWISLWNERVVQYRCRSGADRPCPAMAVVIQPMLSAQAAGVAYSIHPVTGRTSQVSINAVPGLALSLVNGEVTPDQYVVEVYDDDHRPFRVRRRTLARKRRKLTATPGGLQEESIPEPEQQQSCLTDKQLFELTRMSKRIEVAFRQPVDLEWAWDVERLWIVQARPITAVRPWPSLTNDECEWTRANFKETLPELPSPLGLSFLERFMEAYIVTPYRRLGCTVPEGLSSVRVLHGRPYLNVTLFYTLVMQLHGNPAFLIEQMGGEPVMFTPSVRPLGALALVRAGVGMMQEWRKAAKQGPKNFAAMKAMAERYHYDRIQNLSVQELAATLDSIGRWLDDHEVTFAIAGGVAQSLQALGTVLPGWLGSDWRELLNGALQGQGTVVSAAQIVRLAELVVVAQQEETVRRWCFSDEWTARGYRDAVHGTQFLRLFDQYLAEYGHRAVGESDIMSPRIADQPDAVLALLQGQVRAGVPASPQEMLSRQAQRREQALSEIARRFGWRRHRWLVFRWWYRRLSRFCALREENRHHLMYYSTAARHLLLRLGERMVERGSLAVREDVFYLTLDERIALPDGASRDWQSLVRRRREERLQHEALQVPDTIRDWEAVVEQGARSSDQGREGVLRGIAISAGVARGPVRLIRSTADWERVRAGDILVVPVIDPGMAPLFGMAAGLIAEMGGTLSHGAIIAREYGLPVLVNVPYVTSLLRENEQVEIASSTGLISRLVS
jgi:phosphohistidine swiveling domain-containing protein